MIDLSAGDVLAIGIDLERKAAGFYAQAARQAEDEDCRELLLKLSRMEVGHERRLQSWLERLALDDQEAAPETIAQAQVILSTLALGPFLQFKIDPNIRLAGNEPAEKIIEIGIGFEQNAIIMLSALRNLVPPGIGRESVDAMRVEECRHRKMLEEQLVVLRLRNKVRAAARRGLLSHLVHGD